MADISNTRLFTGDSHMDDPDSIDADDIGRSRQKYKEFKECKNALKVVRVALR